MLIGYVSDEQYVAVADAVLEFERDGATVAVARSTPSGRAVFSVGSITYCSSLLVDPAVSRITRIVLARFLGDRA